MAELMSLEGILKDEQPAGREPVAEPVDKEPAAAEPAEPKVERVESIEKKWEEREQGARGRVRDPATGQFVQKTEQAAADPKADPKAPALKEEPKPAVALAPRQEMTDKERAFLRGMEEERGKRQALEQRLAALEAGKTQPGAATGAPKTFWDDPEGALAKHQQEIQQVGMNTRLNTAEMIARSRLPDFDEKVQVFRDILSKAGPSTAIMVQQWVSSPDPAMHAYNLGKNQLELQQVGGLDALREKITKETEAKVRAQIEAEVKAKSESLDKARAELPGSLSDVRSSGVNRPAWGGVPTLDDILKP